jgi:hypothetical protein
MKFRAGAVVFALENVLARIAATTGPTLENSQREVNELQAGVKTKPRIPANSALTQGFAQ